MLVQKEVAFQRSHAAVPSGEAIRIHFQGIAGISGLGYPHQPVLVHEVVRYLCHKADGTYVDGTVGPGGHSEAIGRSLTATGRLICLDRDPEAIRMAGERLTFLKNRVKLVQANFADLDDVLSSLGIQSVDGVLLDLGLSSWQIEHSGRGFSFNRDEHIDMRMDPNDETTAYELVNALSLQDIERILKEYGEEKRAGRIARAVVRARAKKPLETSSQLADVIRSAFPSSHRFTARHPATRTFQAFRIAVNRELQNIDIFLDKIPSLISAGGRLVVISYHSLEDRRFKQTMMHWERTCTCPPDFPRCVCGKVPLFRRLFRKGIKAGTEEVHNNPRARSAVLRAAERIQP